MVIYNLRIISNAAATPIKVKDDGSGTGFTETVLLIVGGTGLPITSQKPNDPVMLPLMFGVAEILRTPFKPEKNGDT
jgi:hypothetical protein